MPRKLTAADYINRAKAKGFSQSQIAKAIGRDQSYVSQVARGKKSGKALLPAFQAISERKRPKAGAPVKPAPHLPTTKHAGKQRVGERRELRPGVERVQLARGRQINRTASPAEVERIARSRGSRQVQIVVHFANGQTGRLFRKGGWNANTLAGALASDPQILADYAASVYQDVMDIVSFEVVDL